MKGNETTEAQGQALQLLFTYQGLAEESGNIRDASLLLALKADGAPNFLASAVINFPVIDQKTVLFIHDLQPYRGYKKERLRLLEAAEAFAKSHGYQDIYISTGRQKKNFLSRQGFLELPDRSMAKKELRYE